MIKSMTGFGRGSAAGEIGTVTAEIKTVNSRFLEMNLRTDSVSAAAEEAAKQLIKASLARGKTYIALNFTPAEGRSPARVTVEEGLLDAYIAALETAGKRKGVKKKKLEMGDLLRVPVPWLRVSGDTVPDEALIPLVEEAVRAALAQLAEMRLREGGNLAADVSARLDLLEEKLAFLRSVQDRAAEQYETRLRERIETLLEKVNVKADEGRILEEVAILSEKTDYTEEVVRFGSHLKQFRAALSGDGPVGRKLDFLLQELNREANTTASKASDLGVVDCVIVIKTELEKIREQIQNME